MVYPHEHVLLRFNGHFGTPTGFLDRWSVGMRFGKPGSAPAFDTAKLQTFVNSAQTAATTFHSDATVATGTATYFDQVAGAQIGVLGKYSPAGQLTILSPSTPQPGSGTPVHPWNTAHVLSLRTAIPRGRGSNGRVYWPCQALAVTAASGRVAGSIVTNRVTAFKTFVNALNAAANVYDAGTKLIVASFEGGGLYATVTAVRADDRLDSIERRENDTPVTWVTQAVS